MIAIKTNIKKMPEYCDDCRWYGTGPHPMKGWTDICELMNQCLDDDQEEGWIYDGNGRPKNCPLMEVQRRAESLKELKAYRESRKEITREINSGKWSELVVYGLDKAVRIMEKHLREVNNNGTPEPYKTENEKGLE